MNKLQVTDFARAMYEDSYLLPNETIDDLYHRVAYDNCRDNPERAERIKSYFYKLWACGATPVMSNSGTDRGYPISCFTSMTYDSLESIAFGLMEDLVLGSGGGGIGRRKIVRGLGESISNVGTSSGKVPFLKVDDSMVNAVSQGALRRASKAEYLHISDPEIEEFIKIRKATGGDSNRKTFNLHHAIIIPDSFVEKVIKREMWDLVSVKTGEVVKEVGAYKLWSDILLTRIETGEPYLMFEDNINRSVPELYKKESLTVQLSNLCVVPETKILTDKGYVEIQEVAGTNQNIWNGFEWSNVLVRQTGTNQEIVKVITSTGDLECTPYHKFYVMDKKRSNKEPILKRASELEVGDKLMKFNLPVIEGEKILNFSYENGFFTGDGCQSCKALIYLYHDKQKLRSKFNTLDLISDITYPKDKKQVLRIRDNQLQAKYFVPDATYTIKSRIDWFSGLLDADGCLTNNNGTQSLQIAQVNVDFLFEVRLMLHTLGVDCKVTNGVGEEIRMMPKNDGSGGLGEYACQATKRLLIPEGGIQQLIKLGLSTERVVPTARTPQRECSQFIKILEVVNEGRISDTYCFTESKRSLGMFNGMLTGNCSEILLNTDEFKTAVCCLSSVNLEKYDEWKDDPVFIEDMYYFLDGVLIQYEEKLLQSPEWKKPFLHRVLNFVREERAVGLGVMGWHSLLQSKSIPFESPMAKGLNIKIFKDLREKADKASIKIAQERGSCELAKRHNILERFSHKLAIAPTSSISILCGGVSAGIEPWQSNGYVHKNKTKAETIKNKHLDTYIRDYAEKNNKDNRWVAGQWKSIIAHEGSVQHLEWMDSYIKEVFKTAFELDQRFIIEQASDRGDFIDQGQSTNIFLRHNIHKKELVGLHLYAWAKKLKTLYYCRSTSPKRASIGGEVIRNKIEVPELKYEVCNSCQ